VFYSILLFLGLVWGRREFLLVDQGLFGSNSLLRIDRILLRFLGRLTLAVTLRALHIQIYNLIALRHSSGQHMNLLPPEQLPGSSTNARNPRVHISLEFWSKFFSFGDSKTRLTIADAPMISGVIILLVIIFWVRTSVLVHFDSREQSPASLT